MSEVSKQILNKPRWARSSQELLHVEIALRTIKDYADYPVAIQQRIAEVGEYRKYESRRIIVREGHPAWNFYFILSGSVVVLVMDEERSFVKPKAILKRGQSFGELAIIHSDRRRSTIVAMEDTEMLSIWYEDYEAIFMDGGSSRSEDEFITSLPFIRAWPLSMADDQPEMFRYHFYKRSEIVVRNSNVSSWIIVVKSGSLSVLKRLQKVTPFEWRQKNSKATGQGHTTDQGFTISRKSMKKQNQQKKKAVEPTPVSLQNVREISSLDQMDFKQEILTAADDLDKGYITADKKTGDDNSKPMFVHVQTLTKGQAFGLYDIVLGQQPSFCVVSNGAEVIMIDKEFFLEHATDRVLKDIRVEAQAYPSDAELQTNLQVAVDWDAYKASTFQTVVEQYYRFKV